MYKIIVEQFDEQKGYVKVYEQTVETLDISAVMAVVNKKKRIRRAKKEENHG
jgi:hypothetical protein